MLENLLNYFVTEPRRLENLGRTLATLGAALIMAGLFGHFEVTATSVVGSLAGQSNTVKTLSETYPSLPTWWIPEGIIGGILALFLAAAGIWLNVTGKQLRRFIEQ